MFILYLCFFFFNDTATTEIYTLSLHDALPISACSTTTTTRRTGTGAAGRGRCSACSSCSGPSAAVPRTTSDRKSTRLNSSHANISYAVFCLKKKKKNNTNHNYEKIQKSKMHII